MSITDQYGDTLINGLLAGAKFRGLQEDLKLARLQRLDFEHSEAFRNQQRELQLQLGAAELARTNQALSIGDLEKQQAEFALSSAKADRPLEVGRKKADLATSKAATKGQNLQNRKVKQDLTFAAREQPIREQVLQTQLAQNQAATESSKATTAYTNQLTTNAKQSGLGTAADLAKTVGGSLAYGNQDPSPNDVLAMLTQAGVDQKAMPVMAQMVYSEIEKAREERDQHRKFISDKQAEQKANAERDAAAALGQRVMAGVNAANIVGQNPAILAGIESAFKDDPVVLALARSGATKQVNPGAKELGSALGNQYEALLSKKTALESNLADIEAGNGTYIIGSRSGAAKKAKQQVESVDRQLKSLETQIRGLYKTSEPTDSGIPVVTTQAAYDKLPKGAKFREEPNGEVFVK